MTCDFEDASSTGMIITTYGDSTAKVFEFIQTYKIAFKRRVDIIYDSVIAVEALSQSAHICRESFDLVCLKDTYSEDLNNHAVACHCKRFVRLTFNTFWQGHQSPSRDYSSIDSGKRYNYTSAQ